ncbi:hypothetical protein CR161_03075 [Prosthecochloris sp. ZM]|nr:hypothetical protein CR161_03075 [Prosthecochloris sp. ZM]
MDLISFLHQSLFTNHYSPITIHQSLFTNHYSPITIHQSPFTNHHSPFTSSFCGKKPSLQFVLIRVNSWT